MSLTHKSQSALEYLMTYGWAILIIVIVAAVLYSFGIFSPSSSITSSVTGFSNLGSVIAQVIPNSGLMLSLGDSAGYNINITNITISLNGKTSTIEPNTLISPSFSSKFFIPFSSVSASSSYSFAVTVHYTEPGQVLPGPYISKGTVYGTATSSSGFYQSITITNSQTTPTPAPFQQMINLSISDGDWYTVTNMIASNYQNVEFFSSNGTIIPSWLENYSSSQFIYWIKLQNGIPASSSVTIYMVYLPKSDNVLNSVNDGEAPQIPCGSTPTSSCSNYAEYDDGANVFNFYNNFAGDNLNKVWITHNVDYHILNGLNVTETPSNPGWVYANFKITTNNLIGFYGEFGGYYNVGTSYQQVFNGIFFQCVSGACHGQEQGQDGVVTTGTVQSTTNSYYFIEVKNSTSSSYFQNHNYIGLLTIGGLVFPLNLTAFITNGPENTSFYINYIFSSTSLINGVTLPFSFGSVS